MSSSSTKTAVSPPISVAIDSYEDSDEAEDTINVPPIDLTSSDSLRPRRAPALEAVDSSDEAPDSKEAPESSNDVVVFDSQPPVPTSSANPTRTAKRKRTIPPPPSTPHLARS